MNLSLIWAYMKGGVVGMWNEITGNNKQKIWAWVGVVLSLMLVFYWLRSYIIRTLNRIFKPRTSMRRSYSRSSRRRSRRRRR